MNGLCHFALFAALASTTPSGGVVANAATTAAPAPRFAAELPFSSCEGLVCLAVTLDGGQHQTLILDTGDVNSYVTADTAKAAGWALTPFVGRSGKPVAGISRTGPVQIHLGNLALETTLMVFDPKLLGPQPRPYDGALVFTALHDRVVQIDFPHHVVRISELVHDTAPSPGPGSLKTITFGHQGPPILTGGPFTVNGRTVQAQIDTAFTGTMLIYDQAIAGLGLQDAARAAVGHGQSFPFTDGGVTMLAAPAASVGFADRLLDSAAPTIYFPTPGVHQPDGLFEATVGTAFFRRSVLTLDLHDMKFDVQAASVGGS